MDYFPIFMKVEGKKVLIIGACENALHKVRLLRKTTAQIILHGDVTDKTLQSWVADRHVSHTPHAVCQADLKNVAFAYISVDTRSIRDDAIALFEANRLPYNVIDDKARSSFITPAMVDRDPVVVAIGTEGTGPIIARDIKARIERELHPLTGLVAKVAGYFRPKVEKLAYGAPRRKFWQRYLDEIVPAVIAASPQHPEYHLNAGLTHLLATHDQPVLTRTNASIRVVNVEAGSADLLTRQALTWLHDADVVFYHEAIPDDILELTRRESSKITYPSQRFGSEETAALLNASRAGRTAVVLVSSEDLPFNEADAHISGLRVEQAAYIPTNAHQKNHFKLRTINTGHKPEHWLKSAS